MNSIVRSNRFNYNKEYKGPRFYTFSTWAHDITQYFMTSSGTVAVPVAYIALNVEKPVEEIKNMLETYFENKIAHYQKLLTDTQDSGDYQSLVNNYAPLQYLFDGLELCGAVKFRGNSICKAIYGDISELNFNGSFTDIICTIPHGAKLKQLTFTKDSLIRTVTNNHQENLKSREAVNGTYQLVAAPTEEPYFDRNVMLNQTPQWDKDADLLFYDIPSSDDKFTLRLWTDYVEVNGEKVPRRFKENIFGESSENGTSWLTADKLILLSYYHDHMDVICNVLDENNAPEPITKVSMTDVEYKVKMVTGDTVTVKPKGISETAEWKVYDTDELSPVLSIYPSETPIIISDITLTYESLQDYELSIGKVFTKENDLLLGWTDPQTVWYDTYDTKEEVTGKYLYTDLDEFDAFLQFINIDDDKLTKFNFNCIIPLYKEYNRDSQLIEPQTVEQIIPITGKNKLSPLGIWFNEELAETGKYQEIEVEIGENSNKYTASWSLSISNQIKPYYASNSVPVTYTDARDTESTMQTFSGVLARVQELGNVVKQLQDTIPHNVTDINTTQGLINRVTTSERMINLLNTGLSEVSRQVLEIRDSLDETVIRLGSAVDDCTNKVIKLNRDAWLLGTRVDDYEIQLGTYTQMIIDTNEDLKRLRAEFNEFSKQTESNIQDINNEIEVIHNNIDQIFEWNTLLTNTQIETMKKLQVIETYWPIITMFIGNDAQAVKLGTAEDSHFCIGEEPVGKSTASDLYGLEQYSVSLTEGPNRNYIENERTEENS